VARNQRGYFHDRGGRGRSRFRVFEYGRPMQPVRYQVKKSDETKNALRQEVGSVTSFNIQEPAKKENFEFSAKEVMGTGFLKVSP
jgi:hypothetical protein